MPRLYISNSRGRQQILAGNRAPRLKEHKDDTYQDKQQKKRRGGAKYSTTTPTKARRKQAIAKVVTDDESTTSGMESADEDDAEEDDGDTPKVPAPPRAFNAHEAGRYQYDRSDDNLSEAGETDSMFGGSFNPEEEEELQNRLLDDNDEAYLAVEDISESDLDEEKILEEQAKHLLVDVNGDELRDDSEDPSFYLNQIEGMSAYGFGDDSDGTMQFFGSSPSSDSGNETLTRHVRFEEIIPEQHVFRGFSESPTMTRALLPSALPHTLMHSLTGEDNNHEDSEPSEETDSDLTDDDLPEAALDVPEDEEISGDDLTVPSALPKKLRPPPVGRFIDDGSQSAGILDSTGTMLLITNPQSLGEEFARRYGASAPPSPGLDFAEAVLESNSDSPQTPGARIPDPMFSGLNSRANATPGGQTVSIPEAFFAPDDDISIALNAAVEPFDDNGSMFSDMDEGEHLMKIEDIVSFDTDSDEESPTSPVVGFDPFSSPGLSHLTNGNVMAFRRNADPAFRAMHSSPIAGHAAAARAAKLHNSAKARRAKKRKATNESPYHDQYYKGVTPVQRVSHPGNDLPMPASSPTKRQRLS